MRKSHSYIECTLIILAGGQGTRMGSLGHHTAKSALIVYDTVVLGRLIEQAVNAGIREIVVSTNPSHYDQICAVVAHHAQVVSDEFGGPTTEIRTFENREHYRGPLAALQAAIYNVSMPRCVMCPGDIYFRSNPFSSVRPCIPGFADWLGVAEAVELAELSQGGIVRLRDDLIHSVVERPSPTTKGAMRWSGIAVFDRDIVLDLDLLLLNSAVDLPEGELFEYRRTHGKPVSPVPVPDFVNINSPRHLLLASLYRFLETCDPHSEIARSIKESAQALRHAISSDMA